MPINIFCDAHVIVLAELIALLPTNVVCALHVVVTVELNALCPTVLSDATVATPDVTEDIPLAFCTLTPMAFAIPDVTETVDEPSSRSAVEYLPLLNLFSKLKKHNWRVLAPIFVEVSFQRLQKP